MGFRCGLVVASERRGIDSVSLRTLDALHVALVLSGSATHVLTFDLRMRAAALQAGLNSIDLGA